MRGKLIMRKFAFLICVLSLVLTLCACGADPTPTTPPTTTVPVATTTQPTTAPSTDVTYTVYVKDADGNAMADVLIQFCDDTNVCKLPVTTDAEGKVTVTYAPANYHVSVTVVPEGYTADADGYYFSSGETELTVTLEKAN